MIKKIVLEFEGKKLEVSLDQALRLRDELNTLFSVKTEYIPYPVRDYYPPYVWYSSVDPEGTASLRWSTD